MNEIDRKFPIEGKIVEAEKPCVSDEFLAELVIDFIDNLDKSDLISHDQKDNLASTRLDELFEYGLPENGKFDKNKTPEQIAKDLKDVLYAILDRYNFWSTLNRGYPRLGLPTLGLIDLRNTDPDSYNPSVRFSQGYKWESDGEDEDEEVTDGSMQVYSTIPQDYGIGMDTLWMTYEEIEVSPEGVCNKRIEQYPSSRWETQVSGKQIDQGSIEILRKLITVALNGAAMQEKEELAEWLFDNTKPFSWQEDFSVNTVLNEPHPPIFTKKQTIEGRKVIK